MPCFDGVKCVDKDFGATCGKCPKGHEGDGRNCTKVFFGNPVGVILINFLSRWHHLVKILNVSVDAKMAPVSPVQRGMSEMVKIAKI